MVNIKLFILSLAIVTAAGIACGMNTATQIFDPNFRTLKVQVLDNFMAPPVIRMGTDDRIVINFDEIGETNSYLEFRLLHCNADWQPSRLIESEYVDGFNSQRIEDYAFSTATFVHYTNYRIELPNDDMRILHSGNYLLQVYNPDSPEEVLLQARFQVSENRVAIGGRVTSRTDKGYNSEWQQLAIAINGDGLGQFNPYQDIRVDITQNLRDMTRRTLKTPLRVEGKSAVYEHLPDLIFPAGNEYRRFESTSNAFAGMSVDSLRYMGSNYHVWLKPDSPRVRSEYSYDVTQHGRFMVREYNSTDSDIGADYITVHFTLNSPEYIDGDVYVDGEFTHGLYSDYNRMVYDRDLHMYQAEIPVKQGAYNYQYVVLKRDEKSAATPAPVEGNKYETSNEYGVAVYFTPPGARADRLAGYNVIM